MNNTELYAALGVSTEATPEEIKKAYKNLTKIHHPDVEGGSEEIFKKIAAAYDVLGKPERRKEYDLTGKKDFKDLFLTQFSDFICNMIIPMLNEDTDNPMDASIEFLNNSLERFEKKIKEIEKQVKHLNEKVERITRPDNEANFIKSVILTTIEKMEQSEAAVKEEIKLVHKIINEIKNYKYNEEDNLDNKGFITFDYNPFR